MEYDTGFGAQILRKNRFAGNLDHQNCFISFLFLILEMGKIIKVKAVSPSPFYDGKYHPPANEQFDLLYYDSCKIEKNLNQYYNQT